MIRFAAKLEKFGSSTLLRLPKSASVKLPSRGVTMVTGTLNGLHFQAALEPDGAGSHWLKLTKAMRDAVKGDKITLAIEPTKEWSEPDLPADLKKALAKIPKAHSLWKAITPMARWDWIRWINATKSLDTRKRRIEIACSKLNAGMRRPCCFNRSMCTDTSLSNNGVLFASGPK